MLISQNETIFIITLISRPIIIYLCQTSLRWYLEREIKIWTICQSRRLKYVVHDHELEIQGNSKLHSTEMMLMRFVLNHISTRLHC